MEPLHQPELGRRPILGVHVLKVLGEEMSEPFGQEVCAVIRDQEGAPCQVAVDGLCRGRGFLDGLVDLVGGVAGGQPWRQQITGEVVDDRHGIPPAMAGDVDVGHVRQPQVIGAARQKLERLGRLIEFRRSGFGILQQAEQLEDPVDRLVGGQVGDVVGDELLPPAIYKLSLILCRRAKTYVGSSCSPGRWSSKSHTSCF